MARNGSPGGPLRPTTENLSPPARPENVGRNKLAQFRQPYGKHPAAMPELRKLVPAYGPLPIGSIRLNQQLISDKRACRKVALLLRHTIDRQ